MAGGVGLGRLAVQGGDAVTFRVPASSKGFQMPAYFSASAACPSAKSAAPGEPERGGGGFDAISHYFRRCRAVRLLFADGCLRPHRSIRRHECAVRAGDDESDAFAFAYVIGKPRLLRGYDLKRGVLADGQPFRAKTPPARPATRGIATGLKQMT